MGNLTRALLILILAATGCKKDKASQAPEAEPPASTNGLWELAPEGMTLGIVARPGAAARLHAAFARLRQDYARLPGADELLAEMDAELAGAPPWQQLASGEPLDTLGLAADGGAAFFFDDDGGVMVLPVRDRDAFTKAIGARSRERDGERIDVFDDWECVRRDDQYLCASDPAWFERLGKNASTIEAEAERPEALRGDLELRVDGSGSPSFGVTASALLDRGAVTVRARLEGELVSMIPVAGFMGEPGALAKKMTESPPAGFLRIHFDPAALGSLASPEPSPLGASDRELLEALTGEVLVQVPAGESPGGLIQVGLSRPEVLRPVIEKLCPMIGRVAPGSSAELEGERCSGTLVPPGPVAAAGLTQVPFELSVTEKAVVMAVNGPAESSKGATYGGAGQDLLTGDWSVAMWGAGAVPPEALEAIAAVPGARGPQLAMVQWLLLHQREMGLALRSGEQHFDLLLHVGTQWSNSDEILAKLAPLYVAAAGGKDVSADIAKLASDHPRSPLGRSHGSGPGGLLPAYATVGVVAAIAVPAFMKYIKKSKAAEARAFTRRMFEGARASYFERPPDASGPPRFPTPGVGPTPPPGACCAQGDKCAPDAELWTHPTWVALQFSVDDPHYYSYQYIPADDGSSFTVRAIGDLDCDGVYSTFEMHGDDRGGEGPTGDAPLYAEQELE